MLPKKPPVFRNVSAKTRPESSVKWSRGRRPIPAPSHHSAPVADHIEHIRDVAGIDHVGFGSDFDGISTYVEGLGDVSTFPALFVELARRRWSDADLRKVAGENILRVMREAEATATPAIATTVDNEVRGTATGGSLAARAHPSPFPDRTLSVS